MSAKDIYEAVGKMLMRHAHLRLIVFDPVDEVIVKWIN